MPKKDAPTVSARNEQKKVSLYRNSRSTELQGRQDGFVYQSFSPDPDHPSYIGKRLRRHEIGNQATGFATVEPWEVCQDATNSQVRALDPRTDQGKAVDTTLRYGRQIVCRIPVEEYAKYEAVDASHVKRMEAAIYGSPDRIRSREASMTMTNVEDENADTVAMLRNAGHPMPGQ